MAERDRDAIIQQCTRFVPSWVAAGRDPAGMFRALAEGAGQSADVYGEGESVKRLESRVAELLGKESAAVFPTGTMAQQIALRIWCDRNGRRTVAFHPQCHVEVHEEKGYERLHGLHARLVGDHDRPIALEDLEAIAEPLGALLLELPQRNLGGRLPPWDDLVAQTDWARSRDIALHLDGARLWQCGPYYERELSDVAGLFDTVYVSLYKDLGGLAGSVLAGSEDFITEARVWRVRHGGRLSSFEAIALSAERGLDEILPRMPLFVAKAQEIGVALAGVEGIEVVPEVPQVAMLHVFVRGTLERLRDALLDVAEEHKVLIAGWFSPTPLPEIQVAELGIGSSTLDVPTDEIAQLYAELGSRASLEVSSG